MQSNGVAYNNIIAANIELGNKITGYVDINKCLNMLGGGIYAVVYG